MDFEKFYDKLWETKGDEYDLIRLNLVAEKVNPGEKVLELVGHIGLLGEIIQEKGSDVNLAIHVLNDAWKDEYDCAVIVSNDSDLAESLRLIKEQNKKRASRRCLDALHPLVRN